MKNLKNFIISLIKKIKTMRTLNVKQTNNIEISENWKTPVNLKGTLYVRCNSKGKVNWDKTIVFFASELVGRNNVVVHK